MSTETKEMIAEAARTLLVDHHTKKLTVKEIVDQCKITRQAFYYHFEDIPELFRWMIEKEADQTLQDVLSQENAEDGLRCFFATAINAIPYVKRGMESNYQAELEKLLCRYIQRFFALLAEKKNFYTGRSPSETKFILRYHSCAIQGLLHEWTEEDSEHLDEIVHTTYCLMMNGIPTMK